jgi:hypothetical protein
VEKGLEKEDAFIYRVEKDGKGDAFIYPMLRPVKPE